MLPPHDFGAETMVLSAVLWGDRKAAQLRLRARWLFGADNRCVWRVLCAVERLRPDRWRGWGIWRCDGKVRVGIGADVPLVARVLAAGAGNGPLWYWQRRLRQIMGYGGDPEECARIIRRLARQRQLLGCMAQIDAALRAGEAPDARLVRAAVVRLGELTGGET